MGSKISYADIVIYYFCTFFFDNKDGVAAALKPCEKISAICAAVGSNDKVNISSQTLKCNIAAPFTTDVPGFALYRKSQPVNRDMGEECFITRRCRLLEFTLFNPK